MPKFTIPVVRISYQHRDIEVEAETQEEANNKALDEAGNHLFDEKNAEYQLESSIPNMNVVTAALQGAYTMIGDMASGTPESELHQTPEEQRAELESAMKELGSTPQD